MKKVFAAALVLAIFLMGCATLDSLLTDAQEIAVTGEAAPNIEASRILLDDIVENPWDNAIAVLVGYGLAIFRRWYKRKRGSKTA